MPGIGTGFGLDRLLNNSGDVAPFVPPSQGDLQLWLTVGDLDTITKDGADKVSSWVDKSTNAFDFVQITASVQPLYSENKITYDGVNDNLRILGSDLYGTDSSGIIFFSGYANGSTQYILSSADQAVDTQHINLGIQSTGKLLMQCRTIPAGNNAIESDTAVTSGDYYYGYIKSDGSTWTISLNGVAQSLTTLVGGNNGDWFADVPSRDDLAIGILVRASTVYTPTVSNKIMYYNTVLTADEIAEIEVYMSNPSAT